MTDGFVENYSFLEEKSSVKDLLHMEELENKFAKKIDSIPGSAIVALVGPFGSGKSTMLDKLVSKRHEKEIWFEFDAWKYPDRQDLWEGLVLDILKAVSPKELEMAKKEICGTQNDDKKTLVSVLSSIPIPGFSAIDGLKYFFATTPAKRVCDIQEVLNKHLGKILQDLMIIVEDIDRSGDSGIFFLETLKQFLRTNSFSKRIVVIVPMANDNFDKNIDSYLKSIDYFEFFNSPEVKLEQFVDEIFDPKLFEGQLNIREDNRTIWTGKNRKTQLTDFLEGLFREMPGMNMRLLKLILRKANLAYKNEVEDGLEPDFRVTICIETSKYFKKSADSKESYFDEFKTKGYVGTGSVFSSFMYTMLVDSDKVYKIDYSNNKPLLKLRTVSLPFKFIDRIDNKVNNYPSVPYEYGGYDRGFGITSFYLNY